MVLNMKKSEKKLLSAAVSIIILSIVYIYFLEPYFKSKNISEVNVSDEQKYVRLIEQKEEIKKQAKKIFSMEYWKNSCQEQQISMQIYVESLIRNAGIKDIRSVYPLTVQKKTSFDELAVQMDLECSVSNLTKLLYDMGNSEVPLQIKKLQIYNEAGQTDLVRAEIEVSSLWMH